MILARTGIDIKTETVVTHVSNRWREALYPTVLEYQGYAKLSFISRCDSYYCKRWQPITALRKKVKIKVGFLKELTLK